MQKIWSICKKNCPIIQNNFELPAYRLLGNRDASDIHGRINFITRLNCKFYDYANTHTSFYIHDIQYLSACYGLDAWAEPSYWYLYKYALSVPAIPDFAYNLTRIIRSIYGKNKKVLALDLDNTLWGGVIGDDGLGGIQIGELGTGHAFSDFQAWLKELKNRGMLLAVCSKNNEETAKEPFEKHPEMVLRLEDFSMFVANWEDKASNIRAIQKQLNIGMDSMVFLDDNPFERNLVRSMIPEITVPELPEDPAMYLKYLRSLGLFETASYSPEDRSRTQQYREQAERAVFASSFQSYDAYLEGLDMKAVAAPFDDFHNSRIAQLTQRSNQFNLRTVRYTEAEIEALSRDDSHICLYFTLKDKFGDHGLISVVILDKHADSSLFVSQWLMSCRVLKRGMEEFTINKILQTAAEQGFRKVTSEYIPTPKNAMVRDLYEKLGFIRVDENRFEADVASFQYHKTYITEE